MRAVLALVAAALVLGACGKNPTDTLKTDNRAISVDKLFQIDGCQVYRFRDGGEKQYFVRCATSTTTLRVDNHGAADTPVPVRHSITTVESTND